MLKSTELHSGDFMQIVRLALLLSCCDMKGSQSPTPGVFLTAPFRRAYVDKRRPDIIAHSV